MTATLATITQFLPSSAELLSAVPVIISLIMIEGLLSVDNAMAIAAMASQLPKHQQKKALRYGIIGAYAFRGVCILLVTWIASNPWLKIFGSIYLIYLMAHNLSGNGEEQDSDEKSHAMKKSLLATIIAIEVMDLSLSLDNVVAAVALDKRLWVVCAGVFIGILALRFVAGHCIKLIEKFPILQKTAFLLVGFVGVILLAEICFEYTNVHFHINSFQKFLGIIAITVATLLYGHTERGRKFLHPLVKTGMPTIRVLNTVLGRMMLPFIGIIRGIKWLVRSLKTPLPQA